MTGKKASVLFVPGKPLEDIVLNWVSDPDEELDAYGQAFHEAARHLLSNFGELVVPPNLQALPIVFLYRHALELYLKAVILAGDKHLRWRGEPPVSRGLILKTHRLTDLLPDLERVFLAAGWDWNFGADHCKTREQFVAVLEEFDAIDQKATNFRYPVDRKGQGALPSHFSFDLPSFCVRLDPILCGLDGSVTDLDERFQAMTESAAEAYDP